MYLLGVIVLVIGLVIAVAMHELGHMIPAKLFGTLVPEYFIGFGKRIWSFRRGETEYGFKWIPLGGYVKILGMYGPPHDKTICYKGNQRGYTEAEAAELPPEIFENLTPTSAQSARLASLEELPTDQYDRAFYRLPVWKKLIVMAGGITMNLVLSIALVAIAMMGIGIQQPTTTLGEVPQCFTLSASGQFVDGQGDKDCVKGPAYTAGLKPGDKLISWDGTKISQWDDVRPAVSRASAQVTSVKSISEGPAVDVVIERNGQQKTVQVKPLVNKSGDTIAGIVTKLERQSAGIDEVANVSWQMFTGTVGVVVKLPVEVFKVGKSLFTGEPRDPSGVLSIVGAGRIAGEVASTHSSGGAAATIAPSWLDRIGSLIMLLASLNMALFVFNLLPLLPLDGGHVAGAIYEGVKKMIWRIRGKDDPGHVDTAAMMPLAYAVITVFIVMTVILVLADIINPVTLQ